MPRRLMLRRASFLLFSLVYFSYSTPAQDNAWLTSMESGKAAYNEHRYPEAEKNFLAALKLAQDFAPGDANLLVTLRNVAVTFSVQKRPREAEKAFDSFLSQWEKTAGRESAAVADVTLAIGRACPQARLYPETERFLKRAFAVREKVSGPKDLHVAEILEELGRLDLAWLREVGAQATSSRTVSAPYQISAAASNPTAIHTPRSSEVPYPEPAQAQLLNDNAGAEKYGRRALAIREKVLGPDSLDLVPVLTQVLSLACLRLSHTNPRKLPEALEFYDRAVSIEEKNQLTSEPNWAEAIVTHARFHHSQGRFQQAEQLYLGAIALFERIAGKDSSLLVSPLREYASLLRDTNRPLDAEPIEARANALAAKQPEQKAP